MILKKQNTFNFISLILLLSLPCLFMDYRAYCILPICCSIGSIPALRLNKIPVFLAVLIEFPYGFLSVLAILLYLFTFNFFIYAIFKKKQIILSYFLLFITILTFFTLDELIMLSYFYTLRDLSLWEWIYRGTYGFISFLTLLIAKVKKQQVAPAVGSTHKP